MFYPTTLDCQNRFQYQPANPQRSSNHLSTQQIHPSLQRRQVKAFSSDADNVKNHGCTSDHPSSAYTCARYFSRIRGKSDLPDPNRGAKEAHVRARTDTMERDSHPARVIGAQVRERERAATPFDRDAY